MKKTLMIMLALVLVIAMSVTGTLAYLTAQTAVVKNTFTVGNVAITLDETDVDAYGVKDGDVRVKANEYKLIPGHTYIKDPTVHVSAGSENCWVFVKVDNGLANNEGEDTIAKQMEEKGWTEVANGIYGHNVIHKVGDDVVVFDTFTLSGTADVEELASETIEIIAYAIQADNFATAQAAWAAAGAEAQEQQP